MSRRIGRTVGVFAILNLVDFSTADILRQPQPST